MQASVEKLNDLERRMTVRIPAEQVAKETHDRLVSLCRRAKVDGFRPGKAPLKVVERLYGDQVHYDVLGDLLEDSLRNALRQEGIVPLNRPAIDPQPYEKDQDVVYTATFEVAPEFDVGNLDEIVIERPVAQVEESDIDRMVEVLRRQRMTWQIVDRPAADGDRVVVDFEGSIDGVPFDGGAGKEAEVVLGKGNMLADFEKAIVGHSAGADIGCDLTFPEDYHGTEVAGKAAHFVIHVHKVEEGILPEVNDEFAKIFDSDTGVSGLRQSVRDSMERELREATVHALKDQALYGLIKANPFPLPKSLVEAEVRQIAYKMGMRELPEDPRVLEFTAKLFDQEARRRAALGLIVSRLAFLQKIEVDEDRVRQRIARMATAYEDAKEVIALYEKSEHLQDRIRAMVLEEQIVDWLLERVPVKEKHCTFLEATSPYRSHAEVDDI